MPYALQLVLVQAGCADLQIGHDPLSLLVRMPAQVLLALLQIRVPFFSFLEGLSLQAKQRSEPPKKTRACLSQGAPTKRGVCASPPAALLPVDATPVAAVPSTPAAISAKPPAVARPATGVCPPTASLSTCNLPKNRALAPFALY
jgi:hypothetical protein